MFAFILLIAVASAIDFKAWTAKHNKHYTAAEALRRRAIFNKNARFVALHNKQNSQFKLSVEGPFAAMTNAEYQKLLTAYDKPEAATEEYTATDLKAATVDWRAKNKITPVRDQGSCGSCYAFASVAALEGRLLISGTSYTVSNLDLSEQQIVDCSSMNSDVTEDHSSSHTTTSRTTVSQQRPSTSTLRQLAHASHSHQSSQSVDQSMSQLQRLL